MYDADVPQMGHISAFRAELLTEARSRFAQLLGVDFSKVDEHRFSGASLGVEGWASAKVLSESDLAGSCRGDSRVVLSEVEEILEMIPGVTCSDVPPI